MKATSALFPISLALVLAACAGQARRSPFVPPDSAASHEELVKLIPRELFRGDISGENRSAGDTESVYLAFVFLKDEPDDQVPMRVALYEKRAAGLARKLTAATPFSPGDCRRGECRARISAMPGGFQISRESFGADRLRADFRFVADGNDLKLIGKGFQARLPGSGEGRAGICSVFYDYAKARVLRRNGDRSGTEPMQSPRAPHLIADHLRFDAVSTAELCTAPAVNP